MASFAVSTCPQAEDFWQKPDAIVRCSKWRVSFCGRRCSSEVSHPQQYSIATRDTVVPMIIEVPTKYQLSHDRIVVLEIRLHSESPMLYRPALHGNWNALSLARSSLKDTFPTPTFPLIAVLPNRHVFLPDYVWGFFFNSFFYFRWSASCTGRYLRNFAGSQIRIIDILGFLTCLLHYHQEKL